MNTAERKADVLRPRQDLCPYLEHLVQDMNFSNKQECWSRLWVVAQDGLLNKRRYVDVTDSV